MQIVMLGHTGVGKTTYMGAMYGHLQNAINGFSLAADSADDHKRLMRIHREVLDGKWPPNTDQRSKYDFTLMYDQEECFAFNWADYRGGAIRDRRESSQIDELMEDLREADAILIFCDGAEIANGRTRSSEIGRMTQFVSRAIRDNERPLTVIIVYTKMDLVPQTAEGIFEPVTSLIETVSANETVYGTVIPIACGPNPQNVELPVLFALYFGIILQTALLTAFIDRHEELRQEYVRQSQTFTGWVSDIFSTMISEPTYGDMARNQANQAAAKLSVLEKLMMPAETLTSYLEELPTF